MGSSQNPVSTNKLLNALPSPELRELQPSFERIRLNSGDVVYHPIKPTKALYFPEDCIISNLTVFDDGASIESGIVGSEGMTGTELLLSGSASTRETCVQTSGYCTRIEVKKFRPVYDQSPVLQQFIANYSSAFFNQVAQVGACSSHHSVVQRLARLLLMCRDRTESSRIKITHDHLAQMLCVHRPSVTLAASALKEEGMIDYVRGSIAILSNKRLEAAACECYQAISENYRQYLLSLEIRNLHDRATAAEHELTEQMRRRSLLVNESRQHVNNLKGKVNRISELKGDHFLCVGCHDYVLSENGEWKPIEAFFSSRLSLTVHSERCPACVKKSLYNGVVAA
jgi:CRP-like cAMP-binding protein